MLERKEEKMHSGMPQRKTRVHGSDSPLGNLFLRSREVKTKKHRNPGKQKKQKTRLETVSVFEKVSTNGRTGGLPSLHRRSFSFSKPELCFHDSHFRKSKSEIQKTKEGLEGGDDFSSNLDTIAG